MSLAIPAGPYNQAAALLNVTGTLNLNSSPLHLTAPGAFVSVGTTITLFHTTGGLGGSTFYGLGQGATVTDSAGYYYQISYVGNGGTDVVLTSLAPPTAGTGAGHGRGRGA